MSGVESPPAADAAAPASSSAQVSEELDVDDAEYEYIDAPTEHDDSVAVDDDDVDTEGDDDNAGAAGPFESGAASTPGFTSQFQQLLQFASHLKSAQPEVREKRAQWEKLAFHQRNTVMFQKQDAEMRYEEAIRASASGAVAASSSDDATASAADAAIDSFEANRFPRALQWKIEGGDLYARGGYQQASMQYQRCIGLFQWARRYQTKDGDAIEWNDLLERPEPQADATAPNITVELVAESTHPVHAPLPSLTDSQRTRARQLVFTCLVNIAACEEKLSQWQQVVAVCEAALNINFAESKQDESAAPTDATSDAADATPPFLLTQLTVKALFRCATAYNKLDEPEKALALLQRASKLAPKDALVSRELSSLRRQVLQQHQKDRSTFGGLFERGEIFEGDAPQSAFDTAPLSRPTAPEADTQTTGIDQTKKFMSDYLAGLREQADKDRLKKGAAAPTKPPPEPKPTSRNDDEDEVDAEFDTSASAASSSSSRSSFPYGPSGSSSSPSPESLASMYADARDRFGIDLSDPLVQGELARLQAEHHRTGQMQSERERDARHARNQTRASGGAAKSPSPQPMPSDLTASSWIGPMLFCIIVAAALKWMRIL